MRFLLSLSQRSSGDTNEITKRKGGGGHGSSSKGGSSSSSSSSKGSTSSSKGSTSSTKGSSSSSKGSKGSTGSSSSSSSSSSKSIPLSNTGHTSSSSSFGGGTPFIIGGGSTFAGRQAGGGSRNVVYGSYYYGSGYPYGGYGWWLYQRPLPYVFWPVYIYPHGLYGSREYGPASNSSRPGGPQVAATIQLPTNTTETYRVVGDNSSVTVVLDSLKSTCGATIGATYTFDPDSTNSTNSSTVLPRPEQVIQYYRASSFVLALDQYNNTATLASNAPTDNTTAPANFQQTPLPAGLNTTFLECVNTTIGDAVPLVDPPQPHGKLSPSAISGIVIASLIGLFILAALVIHFCFGRTRTFSSPRAKTAKLSLRMPWRRKQRYASLNNHDDDAFHYDETKI